MGTGFSYVADGANFTSNNAQITADLLTFLRTFMSQRPEWQATPLYIFCESYGGKMGIAFAKAALAAQREGTLKADLK